jgi:ABC-type thiamin/hydroxymethylpyrimidine transport system permease subunit
MDFHTLLYIGIMRGNGFSFTIIKTNLRREVLCRTNMAGICYINLLLRTIVDGNFGIEALLKGIIDGICARAVAIAILIF